jgi:uncharacterized membrane protein
VPVGEARVASGLAERTVVEIRDNFPVWFSLCLSGGHVLSGLTFVQPPQYAAVLTIVFPLFWVAAYYGIARRGDVNLDRSLVASLCLAAVALTLLLWLPARIAWVPNDSSALRFGFEVLAIIWVALLFLHCLRDRGWPGVTLFFLVGAIYGFALENGGITLGYFSEAGYRFYVPLSRTPISSVAGWCTIFYPSMFIAERLIARFPAWRRRVIWPALLATAIALSSDLHFDHLATALGMWSWNERLPAFFLGVPLVNFTSWVAAVFVFAALYFSLERLSWRATTKSIAALLAIPIMLGVAGVVNLLLIGLLEGFSGPSWRIFRDALR